MGLAGLLGLCEYIRATPEELDWREVVWDEEQHGDDRRHFTPSRQLLQAGKLMRNLPGSKTAR